MFSVFVAGQCVGTHQDANEAYRIGLAYHGNMRYKPSMCEIEVKNQCGIRVMVTMR
jgi:hypothetical protein